MAALSAQRASGRRAELALGTARAEERDLILTVIVEGDEVALPAALTFVASAAAFCACDRDRHSVHSLRAAGA